MAAGRGPGQGGQGQGQGRYTQLPLSLGLKDSTVFANFLPGDNLEALSWLQSDPLAGHETPPCTYLWGEPGGGKTHLLQALCHEASDRGAAAVYLPLGKADEFPLEALHGLENVDVVCLDDVAAVAASPAWQRALIDLFERVQGTGCRLVVTGERAPSELRLDPALASRLAWGMIFQLRPLNERQCCEALALRAGRRGLRLGRDAARFLVRQHGADMVSLFDSFERLDQASMAAKKKLTVRFIREALDLQAD